MLSVLFAFSLLTRQNNGGPYVSRNRRFVDVDLCDLVCSTQCADGCKYGRKGDLSNSQSALSAFGRDHFLLRQEAGAYPNDTWDHRRGLLRLRVYDLDGRDHEHDAIG